MNARHRLSRVLVPGVLVLALTVGCNKNPFGQNTAAPAATDQQLALDVQAKILSDAAVANKQMTINANNGVVTLSGEVTSDAERTAAAADAGMVSGVRTVVNNLSVSNAGVNGNVQQPVSARTPQPERPVRRHRERKPATTMARVQSEHSSPPQDTVKSYSDAAPVAAPAPTTAQVKPVDVPPPPPVKVTIPAGTTIAVRLSQPLASDTSQEGDMFHGALQTDLTVDDQVVIPQGAEVTGRVSGAHAAGKFEGKPDLALTLYQIAFNGRRYSIETDQWQKVGNSRGVNTAKKVGGGAAVGAILGGIFGGGRGAAIGAATGGGVGAGAQGLSKAEQVRLNPEAVLQFRITSPLTVTPSHDANAGRPRLDTTP